MSVSSGFDGDFDGAREPMRALRDLISACETVFGTHAYEQGVLERAQAGFTALRAMHGDTMPAELIAEAPMIEPRDFRKSIVTQCADTIGSMRQSEAGLFDAKHSGQRGQDRSDALYDAYQAVMSLASEPGK